MNHVAGQQLLLSLRGILLLPLLLIQGGGGRGGSVVGTKPRGIPSIRVAAIAAAAGLSVVKGHVVSVVVRLRKASVTENAGFVGLAGAADPDNVVLFEFGVWCLDAP